MGSRIASLLRAIGSVLDIMPTAAIRFGVQELPTDAESLRGDWEAIGGDFRQAIHKCTEASRDQDNKSNQ